MCSYVIIFSALFCSVFSTNFPTNLKQCKRSALQDCLKDAIQDALPKLANGVPEFNLPPIDPLFIPSLSVGKGIVVNMVQNYKDINIVGFSKAKIDKVNVVTSTDTELNFVIDASLDIVSILGEFSGKGVMVGVEFVGEGKDNVTWVNVKTPVALSGKTVEKEGYKYMEFDKVTVSFVADSFAITFNNRLIDEERSKEWHTLWEEHWYDIVMDIKPQYDEKFAQMIQNIANGIFSQIPYDAIIPE